jgi:hypothetical protein
MSNPPRSWLTYRPLRIGWHRRPEEDRPVVGINDLDRNPSQKNLKGNRCHWKSQPVEWLRNLLPPGIQNARNNRTYFDS